MNKPRILVLLSTYNGENYLVEQLDSVLTQVDVQLDILIRDDGSVDSTLDIIQRYQSRNGGTISLFRGENLGVKGSFFELIKHASEKGIEYDYFSFCDQDDVWKNNKLFQAVSLLNEKGGENKELPLMYCSVTRMVDKDLSLLTTWPEAPCKPLTMYNAIVENVAVGCTTVINKSALNLIAKHLPFKPEHVIMHDWWIYLCVSVFGKVIFDKIPCTYYRQHDNNVLGGQTEPLFENLIKRIQRYNLGVNQYIRRNQTREFFNCYYSVLKPEDREVILHFLNSLDRNWIFRLINAITLPYYRQTFLDNLIFRLTYIAGKV